MNISSMDGIASLPVNGFYASSKFALEGMTEALWQEIEPIGLRALLVEPGSFRTGIEQRTRFSGEPNRGVRGNVWRVQEDDDDRFS